ncbi:glycosyltransferase family 2 protein [Paenibacillus terrigena]|uniref:glycosyltransferase family 2 protein n=1 Tax=Paenibacillus terrigena TaxID=369333 RepID=UPI0028D69983|nr:glycosyltransferase family 2 protein [Paenibacillus terrigena]
MLRTKSRKKRSPNMYPLGYKNGYLEGRHTGQVEFNHHLEMTSIIIPTYNKVDLLRQCIESIMRYTDAPYEIIVIDNGSTDGTREYLHSLGRAIRRHIDSQNRGFAGAVNIGLMMAKGTSIVILNNDILVTTNWLSNLLRCLHSSEQIAIVGPVTNYISGDQCIEVPYHHVEDMQTFAKHYNRLDPQKWQKTHRLVGFCYLFRRSLLEQTGYFDEGYEVGNFEDDDFVIRVRLQKKDLMIARDTFIHHYGSQSMRALGEQFQVVNRRNEQFFIQKWGNPYELIDYLNQTISESRRTVPSTMKDFYPTHMVVKGLSPTLYWIENGMRHPLLAADHHSLAFTSLSQVDIRSYPPGDAIELGEVLSRWHRTAVSLQVENAQVQNTGVIVKDGAGTLYQLNEMERRRVLNANTAMRWHLQERAHTVWTQEELGQYPEGLPIIAPPLFRNPEL